MTQQHDPYNALPARGYAVFNGVRNRAEYLNLIQRLGRPTPQYDGNIMFDVARDDSRMQTYYSKGSASIGPHTDGHDLEAPPKYLFLYCIRASQNNDGATEVSDFRQIHDNVDTDVRQLLETRPYVFKSKPKHQEEATREVMPIQCPIYDAARSIYRYSTNYISRQSDDAHTKKLVADIATRHAQSKTSILLKPGDVLVVANHHMLHSRTEFSDPNRLLVRAWASVD
ncbi:MULTISPECIES: TauD/TfdA family dioxygenase [Pandoraea]|uniref:TauD/TfdA-like domain-containing protein n=1 Tax=Pandoraea communis TaxID=2508297 RepID=A0A5E4R7M1_9BURK|nr:MULTISPECIES: TauD/TfdA family dioxygenase [Pandoraea]EON13818.1 hypothetical protein C266_10284 [Pandoraea sp. SD6-2]VVD59336.1 hypothetical protein PCO31110_00017 [Pandoraea communis]